MISMHHQIHLLTLCQDLMIYEGSVILDWVCTLFLLSYYVSQLLCSILCYRKFLKCSYKGLPNSTTKYVSVLSWGDLGDATAVHGQECEHGRDDVRPTLANCECLICKTFVTVLSHPVCMSSSWLIHMFLNPLLLIINKMLERLTCYNSNASSKQNTIVLIEKSLRVEPKFCFFLPQTWKHLINQAGCKKLNLQINLLDHFTINFIHENPVSIEKLSYPKSIFFNP